MKFKRNQKYDTLAVYAFAVITASVLCCIAVSNLPGLSGAIKKVFTIISPLTYGFVIAYLLNPVMKFFENKLFAFKKSDRAKANSKKKKRNATTSNEVGANDGEKEEKPAKDRKKLRRVLSIIVTYIVVAALISAFILLLVPQIMSSYEDLTGHISSYLSGALKWADDFVKTAPIFNGKYQNLSEFIDLNEITTDFKNIISNSFKILETASNYLISYAGKFVVEVKNLIIGIILSIYFLWMKEGLAARFKKLTAALFSRKVYINIVNLSRYTHEAFGSFLTGKILDSIIIGLLTFIVMALLRMPFYPLIALFIGLTNIIPVFGPIFGAIPTGFIVLVAEPKKFIVFLITVIIIQQLDGNIIGPKILGERSGISAMWVMIAIIIGGGFFGVAGMIIAVPSFVVLYTILKQLANAKLADKNMPVDTEFYKSDPVKTDFTESPIFIRHSDELPEKYSLDDTDTKSDDK